MQYQIINNMNQIVLIVQDPRVVLQSRIQNLQNKSDFLYGWNYKYVLDVNGNITSVNGFSLRYYYDLYIKYKNNNVFQLIKCESLNSYNKPTNFMYNNLDEQIIHEIINNPEILDCLIDYGYERNKEWIEKIDNDIFKKIRKREQEKNNVIIKYENQREKPQKKYEQPNKKSNKSNKSNKSKRKNRIIRPFPNKSNQERHVERIKQMREKRRNM